MPPLPHYFSADGGDYLDSGDNLAEQIEYPFFVLAALLFDFYAYQPVDDELLDESIRLCARYFVSRSTLSHISG